MAKDIFDDFSCEVTDLSNRSYINCIMRLNRNIDQFELDTSLDMIRPNQQTLRIYNVHLNGCQMFTTVFKARMFHLLAESINSSVKDRLKCPLKENVNYTFSNWTLPETQLPSYIPESTMKAYTKFYIKKEVYFKLDFLGFFLRFGFTLGLLFLLVDGKVEERNFRIIIEEFTPKAGVMNLFDDLHCNVTQLNSRSLVNCNIRLNQQIGEVQMDSTLDLLRPNKPVIRLYNVHFDACQYLTMSHKNPLFGVFKKSIKTAFNDTLTCPLRADFNYTLSNWYINEINFPSIVPECTVKAVTKLHIENKLALLLILRGRVIHTK